MPISLTTPWELPGSNPPETYPKAKIVELLIYPKKAAVQISLEYGDEIDGVWVGNPPHVCLVCEVVDAPPETAFTDLMSTPVVEGETIYDACKRVAYAYLQDTYPHLAGTID